MEVKEMEVMEVREQDYLISYDKEIATLKFQGSLRLIGVRGYEPIIELLDHIVELEPPLITVNLRQLKSLNSSGLTILAKFVIGINQKNHVQMVIQGSTQNTWQKKSLINLQRLMPRLQLEWE